MSAFIHPSPRAPEPGAIRPQERCGQGTAGLLPHTPGNTSHSHTS